MLLWEILCAGLAAVMLLALLLLARPRRGMPLYMQVEEDAENIEWLLMALLRKAPRHQLFIIDNSRGENKRILLALARRYHLSVATEAPPGAPVLYARRGVTANGLLTQYEKSQMPEDGGRKTEGSL